MHASTTLSHSKFHFFLLFLIINVVHLHYRIVIDFDQQREYFCIIGQLLRVQSKWSTLLQRHFEFRERWN